LHRHGATGLRWQQNGHRYSRRFRERDRQAAIHRVNTKLITEVEKEHARRASGTEASAPLHVSELLDRFKREYHGTKKEITEGVRASNEDSLKYFRQFFATQGDPFVAEVTKGHVARYRAFVSGDSAQRGLSRGRPARTV
jgi:hypothetical protein